MYNFEKVTSLFLIFIGLSESFIFTHCPILHCIKKKKEEEETKVFWVDRFELMSKGGKKVKKERLTIWS